MAKNSYLGLLSLLIFLISLSPVLSATITINSPDNKIQTLDTFFTANFTISGTAPSYNCTLYIDGNPVDSAYYLPPDEPNYLSFGPLSEGYHLWNISCVDAWDPLGDNGTSETREIGIGPNISKCGFYLVTDYGTYYLSGNLSCPAGISTGIYIKGKNVTLDGRGYILQSPLGSDSIDYGILIQNSYANVKDIIIKYFGWNLAIYSSYTSVRNITMYGGKAPYHSTAGIQINSNYNDLRNIKIFGSGDYKYTYGITINGGYNSIIDFAIEAPAGEAIHISGDGNSFKNGYINNQWSDRKAIVFVEAPNSSFENITIIAPGTSSYGISIDYGENNNLQIKDVNITAHYGFYISTVTNNLQIRDSIINAVNGVEFSGSYQRNNVTIYNTYLKSSGTGVCIYLQYSNDVTVDNVKCENYTTGIRIARDNSFIYIKNSYIKSSGINIDACEGYNCIDVKNIVLENITTEGGSYGIITGQGGDVSMLIENITISNCKIYNASYAGLVISWLNNTKIEDNILKGNAYSLRFMGYLKGDIYIINNYMNDTENIWFSSPNCANATFILNTTKQAGTNIISGGFLGGNFWGNLSNEGFSQICADTNIDGICDNAYVVNETCNMVDYSPLSTKYDPTPPEITFLTESRDYSPGTVSINLTAKDNVVGCSLNISGTIYDMNRNGNLFWLDYTLSGPVWVYAKCWDPADWRTNYTIKSLYLGVLTGGYGASGYTPSPTSPTYYPLSITVSSPTPVTILIYDTEGNLVKKVEYVTGFSVLHLPEGKYIIKSISDGREQTFELTIDGPKSIMISSQQGISMQIAMWILVIFTVVFFVLLKERRLKKEL